MRIHQTSIECTMGIVRTFLAAIIVSLSFPVKSIADFGNENWTALIMGSLSTVAIHEMGHIVVAEYHDVDYEYDGLSLVYPDADLDDSEHLRIASAGFQAQWIASEIALGNLAHKNSPGTSERSFSRGVVFGHAAISLAYLTFLKDHENGDIEGMSQATGISNNQLALLVAIPAVLDTWRVYRHDVPSWVPKLSIAFKGLGLTAMWTY